MTMSTEPSPGYPPEDPPLRAECCLGSGDIFPALMEHAGGTAIFLHTDRSGLQYSDGIQVTVLDEHGPILAVTGQVIAWIRGRGIRVELDVDTPPQMLEQLSQLSAWSRHPGTQSTAKPLPSHVLESLEASPWENTTPTVEEGPPVFEVREAPTGLVALPGTPAAEREGRPREVSEPNLHIAASEALRGTRVLVIDDDPGIVKMLSRALRRFGCEVRGVEDPPAALEVFQSMTPDVVLLDWVLPAIPGAKMLETLRASGADCPIAVVSGALWWERAAEEIKSMGANAVMEKPIDFEQLVTWIRRNGSLR